MALSPNPDNYVLGKGVVYFNELVNSVYQGERDLGNAPAFSFSAAIEKLEHFSSRGGLRAKDKEVISQITPSIAFTLDEINKENLALLSLGSINTVTQTVTNPEDGAVSAEVVSGFQNMRSELDYRNVGAYTITHGTVTGGPFVLGEAVTSDNADPGTGVIAAVGTGSLTIVITSGTFADTDTLTGGTSSATADASADPVWAAGVIVVKDSGDSTTYVAGTDYELSTLLKDAQVGRFKVLDGDIDSTTPGSGEVLHVTYNYASTTYHEIRTFTKTQIEGFLRFVSDNPVGTQQELKAWRVSLTPTGDTAFIGDDWSTLGFTGEVLKDESGHPDSPYMDIIM